MKKKKQQNESFFIETIDLTPSNNIQPQVSGDFAKTPMPDYDTHSTEHVGAYRQRKRLNEKAKKYGIRILLITLCAYMIFLIIGASLTEYYVDQETGIRKPIVVTYQDVADKHDYIALKDELSTLREILVDIKIIELKYGQKQITQMDAANAFSRQLDKIDLIIPKVSALNVGGNQQTTKNAILGCYKTYLAGYLQEIVKALSNNDSQALSTALQYGDLTWNSYQAAEASLKVLGERLKLADDFFSWDLTKAAEEKDPSIIVKK